MTLTKEHKIEVRAHHMYVDDKPFVVESPSDRIDRMEDGQLITIFRGHLENCWYPEDIEGYFA